MFGRATPCGLLIIRNLDQVLIGVANIDRLDRANRPGARSRSSDNRHAASIEMRCDLGERQRCDKAKIAGAGRWFVGDQAGNPVGGMQIDFLLAEFKSGPALAKMHDFHPEHPLVKRASAINVGNGEYEMIEAFDIHRVDPFH